MHPLALLHMFIWAQNICHFLLKAGGNTDHWYKQPWTQTLLCNQHHHQLCNTALARLFATTSFLINVPISCLVPTLGYEMW